MLAGVSGSSPTSVRSSVSASNPSTKPSARISFPPGSQERRHHLERALLLREALQIDQDAHADDRVVRALEPRGLEDVVVDEAVVALADALACALDHVLGVVHRVDVLDQLAEPLGREAVAAADLEDAHVAGEIRPDVVVLQVALEDVHDVDFDVVGHRSRAVVPVHDLSRSSCRHLRVALRVDGRFHAALDERPDRLGVDLVAGSG